MPHTHSHHNGGLAPTPQPHSPTSSGSRPRGVCTGPPKKWCAYFRRPVVPEATFGKINAFVWHRITQSPSNRPNRITWRNSSRRFLNGRQLSAREPGSSCSTPPPFRLLDIGGEEQRPHIMDQRGSFGSRLTVAVRGAPDAMRVHAEAGQENTLGRNPDTAPTFTFSAGTNTPRLAHRHAFNAAVPTTWKRSCIGARRDDRVHPRPTHGDAMHCDLKSGHRGAISCPDHHGHRCRYLLL